jgi:acyl-CoA thioester hydrolase
MTERHRGFLGSVNTWECDENGHLNVRFFVAKAGEALASFAAELGLAANERLRETLQHMRFLAEARPAAPLAVDVSVIRLPATPTEPLGLLLEVVSTLDDRVHAALLTDVVVVNDAGRAVPLPAAAQTRAAGHLRIMPPHAAPRGITPREPHPGRDLAYAQGLGMFEISRGRVAAQHCDDAGFMETFQFVGRISDGIVNMLARFQGADGLLARSEGRVGGAVVEYRLDYRRRPRAGDLVSVRTGVASLQGRAHRIAHWLFDARSGEGLCWAEVVAVTLDLGTRRAIAMPAEQHARMAQFLIPDLAR